MASDDLKKKPNEKDLLKTSWADEDETTSKKKVFEIGIGFGGVDKFREKAASGVSDFLAKIKNISKGLIVSVIAMLILAAGVSAYFLYKYLVPRDTVFAVFAPADVMAGAPFNLEIELQNNSNDSLKNVTVDMLLPENVFAVSKDTDKKSFSKDFGDLDKRGILKEEVPLVLFGEQESVKKLEVRISYLPNNLGPTTRFEQTKVVEVAIREPGIKLDISAPKKVLSNEDFEMQVQYSNISGVDFSDAELQLTYPPFFIFKSATTSLSGRTNFWKIGDLSKGGSGSVIVRGSINGPENSFFEIKGAVRANFSGQKYVINEKVAGLNISSAPLTLRIENISAKEGSNDVVSSGKRVKYKIYYQNNSDVGLNDVVIKAKLTGEMFNFSQLRGDFFGPDQDNTITWNVANTPELRLIQPGPEKSVEFEIATKDSYPITGQGDKNFTLKIEAEISSPTVPYYTAGDKTAATAKIENKVAGDTEIESSLFLNDTSSGFINKGSLPPKVGAPIQFSIHWKITNYSDDIKNAEVKAFLQSGVAWTGRVKSNVVSKPVYNERTQEVVWRIDKISAGKGVVDQPVEAVFQIEATPGANQVDGAMPILSETTLKAVDQFTGANIGNSNRQLDTHSQKEGSGTVKSE